MAVPQAIIFLLVGLAGTAVVLTRNTTHQAIVASFYGLLLSIMFLVLHAADVALAAVVVGAIGLPIAIVMSLGRVRRAQR